MDHEQKNAEEQQQKAEEHQKAQASVILRSLMHLQIDKKTAEEMAKDREYHHELIKAGLRERSWLPNLPWLIPFMGKCSRSIKKQLEDSDVKNNQARLSLQQMFVEKEFMPIVEEHRGENIKCGIEVNVYDSDGHTYHGMVFKLWGTKMYVLTRQWKEFCKDHILVPVNDSVEVWMFRHNKTNKLCVVIYLILDDSLSVETRIARQRYLNNKRKKEIKDSNSD